MGYLLSKRALNYIAETIGEFIDKCEIVTYVDTDAETYETAIKTVKKMTKKLPDKPEKYLDEDYLTPDICERLEEEALVWEHYEQERGKY